MAAQGLREEGHWADVGDNYSSSSLLELGFPSQDKCHQVIQVLKMQACFSLAIVFDI